MELNELSERVLGCAIEVHRQLGSGLLESVYLRCLARELELSGIRFQQELELPVSYKGLSFDGAYRVDLIIEDQLIVELKAVEILKPVHKAQLLSYLKLSHKPLGLLINFNAPTLMQGVKRVINAL